MDTNILESVRFVTSWLNECVCQVCPSGSVTLAAPLGAPECLKYPVVKNLAVTTKGRWRNRLEALGSLSMVWEVEEAEASQGCFVHSFVSAAV